MQIQVGWAYPQFPDRLCQTDQQKISVDRRGEIRQDKPHKDSHQALEQTYGTIKSKNSIEVNESNHQND